MARPKETPEQQQARHEFYRRDSADRERRGVRPFEREDPRAVLRDMQRRARR